MIGGLTSFDSANITVSGGASLSLPGVTSYTGNDVTTTLEATGTGSSLTLANLATVTEAFNSYPAWTNSRPSPAARVTLSALKTINTGTVMLESDGTGSVLNVPALDQLHGDRRLDLLDLQASNGGTVDVNSLASLSDVNLNLVGTSCGPHDRRPDGVQQCQHHGQRRGVAEPPGCDQLRWQ